MGACIEIVSKVSHPSINAWEDNLIEKVSFQDNNILIPIRSHVKKSLTKLLESFYNFRHFWWENFENPFRNKTNINLYSTNGFLKISLIPNININPS